MLKKLCCSALMALALGSGAAYAVNPAGLADNTRYLSMGDSFAAGKGAIPVTQGYAYRLYQNGVFGSITDVTFDNMALGGTDSSDVLNYQVPQVVRFKPHVITMTVGGNDLGRVLRGVPPATVLAQFAANMTNILCTLRSTMAAQGIDVLIIVSNQPDYPWLSAANPAVRDLVIAANELLVDAAETCGARVADVFSAFDGKESVFLHYRPGADPNESHPTNEGYRVMEKAFEKAATQ